MLKIYILIFLTFLSFNIAFAQSKYLIFQNDTINRIDEQGMRQGQWMYFSEKYANKISQKGNFVDNRKEGVWITYHKSGIIKSEIVFVKDQINGSVKIYTKEGDLLESGTWENNRWVGEYNKFYKNGNNKYVWIYNENGERTGIQKYFYENSSLKIEGYWNQGKEEGEQTEYYESGAIKKTSNWKNGRANGTMTEYYETGEIKSTREFHNGVLDPNSIREYPRNEIIANNNNDSNNETNTQNDNSKTEEDYAQFKANGYNKLFNADKQLTKEGIFRNGILENGRTLHYNQNGILVRTDYYEKGKIVRSERNKE